MDILKFSEYGILGAVIGALFFIMYKMICWFMNYTKEQLNLISVIKISLEQHYIITEEAHKYQREEHKQMIETLARINGYKHD